MSQSDRLPNEAFVVRGGVVAQPNLREKCDYHAGVYGFSVQSRSQASVSELCEAQPIPHRQVGVTTVERIRALGFDVRITPGAGYHATVVVSPSWTEQEAESLAALFVAQPNPVRGR